MRVARYARFAVRVVVVVVWGGGSVRLPRPIACGHLIPCHSLTCAGIAKDDHCICIVYPLDPEPSIVVLPSGEYRLDVSSLELRWEPREGEDASGEWGEGSEHRLSSVGG